MNIGKLVRKNLDIALLLLAILILSAYLIFRPQNNISYTLPEIPEISLEDIASLELQEDGRSILIENTQGQWTAQGYRLDLARIRTLINNLFETRFIDLVSSGNSGLATYGLDAENSVKFTENDGSSFSYKFGKTSESRSYSYVKLPDSNKVYTLRGNITQTVDTNVDALRDRSLFSMQNPEKLSIFYEDQEIVLAKDAEGNWQGELGEDPENLVFRIMASKAQSFIDGPTSEGAALFRIQVEEGSRTEELLIYLQEDQSYLGESSYAQTAFRVDSALISQLEDLVNPEEEQPEQ
jgi:hypothetical protein